MTRRLVAAVALSVAWSIQSVNAQTVHTWRPVAPMADARSIHVVIRLANGKVLVAGGSQLNVTPPVEDTALSSAEIFDPASETWSRAAAMSTPRFAAAAALLADGRVLVAGGANHSAEQLLSSAEIYDPVADTWSSAGAMATARYNATATLLADGRVLVAGGITTPLYSVLASAEIYNPATNQWTPAAPMAAPHGIHQAVRLTDDRVLVVSGWTDTSSDGRTAELYDPVANTWSPAGSLPTLRFDYGLSMLHDGRVLVAGGTDNSPAPQSPYLREAHIYDPVTNGWSAAANLSTRRTGISAATLDDGRVLTASGELLTDLPGLPQPEPTGEAFNPFTGVWSPAGTMHELRWSYGMTPLTNGRVLVEGGVCQSSGTATACRTAEIFGPVSCPAEVTSRVQVFMSSFVQLPLTTLPVKLQVVLIGNPTATPIQAPLAYVVDDLVAAQALTTTTTRCQEPGMKRPYFRVDAGPDNVLAPGEYRLGLAWFFHTVDVPITYTPRVLAGIPER